MPTALTSPALDATVARLAAQRYDDDRLAVFRRTDRLFAGLMLCQFLGGVGVALIVSPRTWIGASSTVHLHVWAAVFLGGLISLPAVLAGLLAPGHVVTRHVIAVAQMLTSALLIHLTGGRIETHFHVFGSLAFLSFYRDWRVLIPATVVVAADHFLRGIYYPASVYGVVAGAEWRWLEHAWWVVFEDVFLVASCLRSEREMRQIAWGVAETQTRNAELTATRDTALDCIITMDHLGRITGFNPAAEKVFGHRAEAVRGAVLGEVIIPAPFRQRYQDGLARYLASGEGPVIGQRRELPALRADGSEFIAEMAITAIRVGDEPRFVAYLRDVTEQRQAERALRKSEERFRRITANVPGMVYQYHRSPEGVSSFPFVSDACRLIYGVDPETVRADNTILRSMVRPEDRAALEASIAESARTLQPWKWEGMITAADGQTRWIQGASRPEREADGSILWDGVVMDITAIKRAEVELQRAKDAAEVASRAKSEFLANMSHEIRTPMTAIIGYADFLGDATASTEERTAAIQTVRRNAAHLLGLINDILDVSKIEAGRMEVESLPCAPQQVLADVASLMRVRAAEKQLAFSVDFDSPVPASFPSDPTRLRQILINLVGNAIKFTDRGSVRVKVRLAGAEAPGTGAGSAPGAESSSSAAAPRLEFNVIDSGIGLTGEQIDRLFTPFMQADNSMTRKFGGTGLGLAISRKLAQLLGGDITVRSCPGVGSSFTLSIPTGPLAGVGMVRDPLGPLVPAAAPARRNVRLAGRVLLAEDGIDNQALVARYLHQAGAEVVVAGDGKAAHDLALDALRAGRPFDVVLMDMQMPVMDGYTATSSLRHEGYTRPIVALTAHAMAEDRLRCEQVGCSSYVSKPIDRERLLDVVAESIEAVRQSGAALIGALAAPGTAVSTTTHTPAATASPAAPPLRSQLLHDPDVVELLPQYLAGLAASIQQIETCTQESNLEALRRVVHQLRGSGGAFGFTQLSEAAGHVEERIRAGLPLGQLRAHVDALVALVRRVDGFAAAPSSQPQTADPSNPTQAGGQNRGPAA